LVWLFEISIWENCSCGEKGLGKISEKAFSLFAAAAQQNARDQSERLVCVLIKLMTNFDCGALQHFRNFHLKESQSGARIHSQLL
jgi:hypothetical protein